MILVVGSWGDIVGSFEVKRRREEFMDFGEGGWGWIRVWIEWLVLERRRDICFFK